MTQPTEAQRATQVRWVSQAEYDAMLGPDGLPPAPWRRIGRRGHMIQLCTRAPQILDLRTGHRVPVAAYLRPDDDPKEWVG